jgi:ABC-type transporter Mla subunit MlaD
MGERTPEIQEQIATLQDLSEQSERQARLLGRVLDTDADEPSLEALIHVLRDGAAPELGEQLAAAQTAVAECVQDVDQRRETLRLALEYATDLNHELLTAMQKAGSSVEVQPYTAEGRSQTSFPDRFFVDATG